MPKMVNIDEEYLHILRSHKQWRVEEIIPKSLYPVGTKNMWIDIWLWILSEIKPEQNTIKKYLKNGDLSL